MRIFFRTSLVTFSVQYIEESLKIWKHLARQNFPIGKNYYPSKCKNLRNVPFCLQPWGVWCTIEVTPEIEYSQTSLMKWLEKCDLDFWKSSTARSRLKCSRTASMLWGSWEVPNQLGVVDFKHGNCSKNVNRVHCRNTLPKSSNWKGPRKVTWSSKLPFEWQHLHTIQNIK